MEFYIRNLRNLVVRLVTFNNCYVCDECRTIHKRNGDELDLTPESKHRGAWEWWYPSVCQRGLEDVMERAFSAIRDSISGKQ